MCVKGCNQKKVSLHKKYQSWHYWSKENHTLWTSKCHVQIKSTTIYWALSRWKALSCTLQVTQRSKSFHLHPQKTHKQRTGGCQRRSEDGDEVGGGG